MYIIIVYNLYKIKLMVLFIHLSPNYLDTSKSAEQPPLLSTIDAPFDSVSQPILHSNVPLQAVSQPLFYSITPLPYEPVIIPTGSQQSHFQLSEFLTKISTCTVCLILQVFMEMKN